MNWLDIGISIILCVFFITGLLRGFVRQVFSIFAIGGGIFIAAMFFDLLGNIIIENKLILNASVANIIGFISILLVVYLVIHLVGWLILKLIGTLRLSWVDRLGGGLLGILFGVILSAILVSSLNFFYDEKDPAFRNSTTYPYLKTAYILIDDSIPSNLDLEFRRARKLIREKGIISASKVKEVVVENKDKRGSGKVKTNK